MPVGDFFEEQDTSEVDLVLGNHWHLLVFSIYPFAKIVLGMLGPSANDILQQSIYIDPSFNILNEGGHSHELLYLLKRSR